MRIVKISKMLRDGIVKRVRRFGIWAVSLQIIIMGRPKYFQAIDEWVFGHSDAISKEPERNPQQMSLFRACIVVFFQL